MQKKYFKLFTDCRVILGEGFSLIYDLGRNKLFKISNDVASWIIEADRKSLDQIMYKDGNENIITYLTKNEIGFITDSPDQFPDFELNFTKPEVLYSSIIEFAEKSDYNIIQVINDLNLLGCKYLTIYFVDLINVNFFLGYNTTNERFLFNKY